MWGGRGDCGGKLYVLVHGGFLCAQDAAAGGHAAPLGLGLEVGGQSQSAEVWGRALERTGAQQLRVLPSERLGPRWWFGALGSACEKGSACPEPAACAECAKRQPPSSPPAEAVKANKDRMLLAKALKNNRIWKKLRGAEQAAQEEAAEEEVAEFKKTEMVFEVKDYFGRLPVTFRVERQVRGGKRGAESAATLVGNGRACLADALSSEALMSPATAEEAWAPNQREFSKRQIVRLVGPTRGGQDGIVGCLVVEMCFIPGRGSKTMEKEGDLPLLHAAVAAGQSELIKATLGVLRRKQQSAVLTRRRPDHFGNMNLYEVAARAGQAQVLQELLDHTNTTTWNEWQSSSLVAPDNNKKPVGAKPAPGAAVATAHGNALHMAILANSPKCAQMLCMHAYKHELSSSLFDSEHVDNSLDLYGLEQLRSALVHRQQRSMLHTPDARGRTPFALACSLPAEAQAGGSGGPGSAGGFDTMQLALLLLEFDQDVCATDDFGRTPLMLAVMARQINVALVLINLVEEGPPGSFTCKAKPNLPDKSGRRPLHEAAAMNPEGVSEEQVKLVNSLLEAGALPGLRDGEGSTPLHLAALAGASKVCEALIEWPAKFELQRIKQREEQLAAEAAAAVAAEAAAAQAAQAAMEAAAEEAAATTAAASSEDGAAGSGGADETTVESGAGSTSKLLAARRSLARPLTSLVSRIRMSKRSKTTLALPEVPEAPSPNAAESPRSPSDSDASASSAATASAAAVATAQAGARAAEEAATAAAATAATATATAEAKAPPQAQAASAALAQRRPELSAVQWRSGKTAAQLAKEAGHEETFLVLQRAGATSPREGAGEASAAPWDCEPDESDLSDGYVYNDEEEEEEDEM